VATIRNAGPNASALPLGTPDAGALLENLLLLPQLLRASGIPVSIEQSSSFVRALDGIDLTSRSHFYYAGRCLLISRREDLRLYDVVFNRLFGQHRRLEPRRGDERLRAPGERTTNRPPAQLRNWLGSRAGAADPELEVRDRSATWSDSEILQHKEFSAMTREELERVKELIVALRFRVSERRTRRLEPARRGGLLDLRRSLRQMVSYGAVPRLFYRRARVKQRPLVLLADISGSMETYSRLVLQFFYALTHGLREVETFVFGTRLSPITAPMRLRNVDRALDEASRQVLDWAGGTRIGASLDTFNRRYARRVLRRGAVVLIISDGWERGDVAVLSSAIRSLQRRCHRLIWLNPLLGKPTYEPRVEGMAAALPYVDDFLPIHNLRSLAQLALHLQALPQRRNPRRARSYGAAAPPSKTEDLEIPHRQGGEL
jgi:uncharacterized protein with von Willebrand factor type A (vWA) domain